MFKMFKNKIFYITIKLGMKSFKCLIIIEKKEKKLHKWWFYIRKEEEVEIMI